MENERNLEHLHSRGAGVDEVMARLPEEDRRILEEYHEFLKKDALTEVYNRNGLLEKIVELADNLRLKQVAVIMGDVNGLKELNDKLGHHGADEVLRTVGRVLKPNDVVGRYGGDEFLLLLPVYVDRQEMNKEVLDGRVADIKSKIDGRIVEMKAGFVDGEWPQKRGKDAGTMSFGARILLAEEFKKIVRDGSDRAIEKLVEMVDGRMYEAKKST